jgi:hypothetical protein
MKFRAWCMALAVFAMAPVAAQVYKVVDSQGRVTYTDSPPKDGRSYEKVELKELNQHQAIEPVPSLAPPRPAPSDSESGQAFIDYMVQIATPAPGTQVPPGQRDLPVAAQVSPPLAEDHALQFLLNGEPLTEPSRDTSLVIEEIFRGEHRLMVRVLDSNGEIMAESDPIPVFVHRPTVNSPAR